MDNPYTQSESTLLYTINMNGVQGLTGFDALLREHKRLATKLTSDELRAIRDYMDFQINHEHAELALRYKSLQNDFNATVRRSSETITELYQELNEKKDIVKQYKESDETLLQIYKQKEQRWDKKQELLLAEIDKMDNEGKTTKRKLSEVETELTEKKNNITVLEEELAVANESVKVVDQAKITLQENEEFKKEILKLKMEIDKRDKIIANLEKQIASLKDDIDRAKKEKEYKESQITAVQHELKRQVKEVAAKCKSLSETQFQLQMEKRQVETLQKDLRRATEDLENYRKILDAGRPSLSPNHPASIVLRKDLDIMDIRIKSLDIGVRLRMDEQKKLEDRLEDLGAEERLASQIKSEIYVQGDTYLELTISELVKKLGFKRKRLEEEMKYAKDWGVSKREADVLRAEIAAHIKQAAICKLTDLGSRASKQLQKIDLIMRGTLGQNTMPKIFRVSEKSNSDQRRSEFNRQHIQQQQNQQHQQHKQQRPAFITSSTPINAFDSSYKAHQSVRTRKKMSTSRGTGRHLHPMPQAPSLLDNHTDDSKIQFIDTTEIDLPPMSPTRSSTPRRGAQSDRMTMKSISNSTVHTGALSER